MSPYKSYELFLHENTWRYQHQWFICDTEMYHVFPKIGSNDIVADIYLHPVEDAKEINIRTAEDADFDLFHDGHLLTEDGVYLALWRELRDLVKMDVTTFWVKVREL